MTTITLSTCVFTYATATLSANLLAGSMVRTQTWCSYGYGYERLMIIFRTISSNGVF